MRANASGSVARDRKARDESDQEDRRQETGRRKVCFQDYEKELVKRSMALDTRRTRGEANMKPPAPRR